MSTNFYMKDIVTCPKCACKIELPRDPELRHIGKRSVGRRWLFDGWFMTSFAWKKFIKEGSGIIIDQFGKTYTPEEMIAIIDEETFDLNVVKTGHSDMSATKDKDGYYISKFKDFS